MNKNKNAIFLLRGWRAKKAYRYIFSKKPRKFFRYYFIKKIDGEHLVVKRNGLLIKIICASLAVILFIPLLFWVGLQGLKELCSDIKFSLANDCIASCLDEEKVKLLSDFLGGKT